MLPTHGPKFHSMDYNNSQLGEAWDSNGKLNMWCTELHVMLQNKELFTYVLEEYKSIDALCPPG